MLTISLCLSLSLSQSLSLSLCIYIYKNLTILFQLKTNNKYELLGTQTLSKGSPSLTSLSVLVPCFLICRDSISKGQCQMSRYLHLSTLVKSFMCPMCYALATTLLTINPTSHWLKFEYLNYSVIYLEFTFWGTLFRLDAAIL